MTEFSLIVQSSYPTVLEQTLPLAGDRVCTTSRVIAHLSDKNLPQTYQSTELRGECHCRAGVGGGVPWEEPQLGVSLDCGKVPQMIIVTFGERADIAEIPWIGVNRIMNILLRRCAS